MTERYAYIYLSEEHKTTLRHYWPEWPECHDETLGCSVFTEPELSRCMYYLPSDGLDDDIYALRHKLQLAGKFRFGW